MSHRDLLLPCDVSAGGDRASDTALEDGKALSGLQGELRALGAWTDGRPCTPTRRPAVSAQSSTDPSCGIQPFSCRPTSSQTVLRPRSLEPTQQGGQNCGMGSGKAEG